MSVTIHQLPDTVLEQILCSGGTLHQRLRVRSVCTRWCSVVQWSLRTRIRSITLFDPSFHHLDDGNTSHFPDSLTPISPRASNHLTVRLNAGVLSNGHFCRALFGSGGLFVAGQLHSLVLYLHESVRFYALTTLLGCASLGSLRSLCLFGSVNPALQHTGFVADLYATIDRHLHRTLRHLHVHVRGLHCHADFRAGHPTIRAPRALYSVRSLSVSHYGGDLLSVFAQLGPNCTSLAFGHGVTALDEGVLHKLRYYRIALRNVKRFSVVDRTDSPLLMAQVKDVFDKLGGGDGDGREQSNAGVTNGLTMSDTKTTLIF